MFERDRKHGIQFNFLSNNCSSLCTEHLLEKNIPWENSDSSVTQNSLGMVETPSNFLLVYGSVRQLIRNKDVSLAWR